MKPDLVWLEQLRRAVLTLLVAPDPEARFRRHRSAWSLPVVDLARDAYGSMPSRVPLIRPTSQDVSRAEALAPDLAWLRRAHGEVALNLVTAWALAVPVWRLADRLKVHQRTIRKRIERALWQLWGRQHPRVPQPRPAHDVLPFEGSSWGGGDADLGHATFANAGRGEFTVSSAAPGKVWVGEDAGWRKNGARWRDGQ